MLANGSENRLTHLLGLGAYNSDSDGEESADERVQGKQGNNGKTEEPVQTDWTQCFDRTTGHPYFWHISTKEVTWEMPDEYRAYLDWVRISRIGEDEHRWKVYEAEDSKVPYYVDEVTRIVSWEMPEEYRKHLESQKRDQKKRDTVKPERKVQKKPPKKYPEHLLNPDPIEDKIELISSYSKSSSESEDEEIEIKMPRRTEVERHEKQLPPEEEKSPEAPARNPSPEHIPSEELLPYKMYTPDAIADSQTAENSTSSSILFSNETSVTLSELEKTYSTGRSSKSPENVPSTEVKSILSIGEEIDVKLTMRKRRIEIPRIPPKAEPLPRMESDQEEQIKTKTIAYANFQSGGVEFTENSSEKREEVMESEIREEKEMKDASTSTAEDETDGEDLKELSSLISAKVKFLSEGRPIVSGVQIMQIQLETLVAAFEAQQLSRHYVMNWLSNTTKSLLQLENDVAPNGWKCKWDRTNSRYYYQSIVTGKIQWDFPEPDVTCHGDEMELCTTPPHPGAENEEPETKKAKLEDIADNPDEPRTPEPPAWNSSPESSPAPSFDSAPPPPRITDKFHSELDSFYSDLATLETVPNPPEKPAPEVATEVKQTTNPEPTPGPKVKKKKVKTSRTEMKEMTMLMAKWQKAQQDLKK